VTISKEQLLAEFEELIRAMPDIGMFSQTDEKTALWLGRAVSLLDLWDRVQAINVQIQVESLGSRVGDYGRAVQIIRTTIYRAVSDLRLKTIGTVNVAVGAGMTFDYFDNLRKMIESAKEDILFVDPYLDAEFVSKYLPYVSNGARIRLLAGNQKLASLVPAVKAYAEQEKKLVELKASEKHHDRYIFIDKNTCYQSGASFKDGAKKALTTLTQLTDTFQPVFEFYEEIWDTSGSSL